MFRIYKSGLKYSFKIQVSMSGYVLIFITIMPIFMEGFTCREKIGISLIVARANASPVVVIKKHNNVSYIRCKADKPGYYSRQ